MKSLLVAFALSISACSPPEEHSESASGRDKAVSPIAKIDYDALLAELQRINYSPDGYEVFQAEWPDLYERLLSASENGALNNLPEDQRSRLWWEVEYLRACAHPEIFRDHNEEIIPILFNFNLPEQNQQLKEILVDSGQI